MHTIAPARLSASPSSGLVVSRFGFPQTGIQWKAPLSASGKGLVASKLCFLAEGLEKKKKMVALAQDVFPSVLGLPPAPGPHPGWGRGGGEQRRGFLRGPPSVSS